MNFSKLLILDGISGVPLGKDIHEAFSSEGMNAQYADLKTFKKTHFYELKSAYSKALNKRQNTDSFTYYPRLNEKIFEAYILESKPTTILVIGFLYKFLDPKFIRKIKHQYNIALYLYDTDSCNLYSKRREFIFFLDEELVIYDGIFSFSKVTTRFFTHTKKLNAHFLPFGAKPMNLPVNANKTTDVLFVGSCDLRRVFLLENIKEHVTIFGDRWSRNYPLISPELQARASDKSLWGDQLQQQLNNSKIVLNITRSHFYGAETGVNLRIFEALASGAFLLTDYCEELTQLFVVGEEIEIFRNATELTQKVDFYLSNPQERERIARQGHARFLNEYTWNSKMKYLTEHMNLQLLS